MIEYRTLKEMREEVGRQTQTGPTSEKDSIDERLNRAYMEAARQHLWNQLQRMEETTVSVVSGQSYLYLPKRVDQVLFMYDGNLEDIHRHYGMQNFIRYANTSKDAAGLVTHFTETGEFGRKAEFSSTAEKITVTPDAQEAGGNVTEVTIVGRVSDDQVVENLTITGSTAGESTYDYSDLLSVSTNGGSNFPLTVSGSTSSTQYATISPNERTARYKRLRFVYVPQDGRTMLMAWKERVTRLTSDNQVPMIGVSQYMVERAIADTYANQRRPTTSMQAHQARATQILESMIAEELMQDRTFRQAVPEMLRGNKVRRIVVNN